MSSYQIEDGAGFVSRQSPERSAATDVVVAFAQHGVIARI